jgi:hypothetical protein
MYDKMMSEMKTLMQPVLDLAETNKKAMEKLTSLQKDSMTAVVNAGMAQFKELSQCKDPKAAMDLQVKFYKDLEVKMTNTAEQSIVTISEAREAFVATIEESAKTLTTEMEEAVKKATGNKVA